jgi:hypothetical protein
MVDAVGSLERPEHAKGAPDRARRAPAASDLELLGD